MDNFMDKLAKRFNAGEMIKANAQAEAKDMKRLKEQTAEYEKMMQEMRRLNLKNIEVTEQVQQMIQCGIERFEEFDKNDDTKTLISNLQNVICDYAASSEKEICNILENIQIINNNLSGIDKNQDINALQNNLSGIDSKIDTLQRSISSINGGISTVQTGFSGINSSISTMQNDMIETNENISALQNTTMNIGNNVNALQNEVVSAVSSVDILKNTIEGMQDGIGSLQNDISGINSGIHLMQTDISEANGNIGHLQYRLVDIENSIKATETAITEKLAQKGSDEDLLMSIIENLQGIREILVATRMGVEQGNRDLGEHIHKENVRVYRNVQAVVVNEATGKARELHSRFDQIERDIKKSSGIKIFVLITMLAAIASVILHLLQIIGLV